MATLLYTTMLSIRVSTSLKRKGFTELKPMGQEIIPFPAKMLFNCITFQSKLLSVQFILSVPFAKSSVASIGKWYPFRKITCF